MRGISAGDSLDEISQTPVLIRQVERYPGSPFQPAIARPEHQALMPPADQIEEINIRRIRRSRGLTNAPDHAGLVNNRIVHSTRSGPLRSMYRHGNSATRWEEDRDMDSHRLHFNSP